MSSIQRDLRRPGPGLRVAVALAACLALVPAVVGAQSAPPAGRASVRVAADAATSYRAAEG